MRLSGGWMVDGGGVTGKHERAGGILGTDSHMLPTKPFRVYPREHCAGRLSESCTTEPPSSPVTGRDPSEVAKPPQA